jgi:hypothetical protein
MESVVDRRKPSSEPCPPKKPYSEAGRFWVTYDQHHRTSAHHHRHRNCRRPVFERSHWIFSALRSLSRLGQKALGTIPERGTVAMERVRPSLQVLSHQHVPHSGFAIELADEAVQFNGFGHLGVSICLLAIVLRSLKSLFHPSPPSESLKSVSRGSGAHAGEDCGLYRADHRPSSVRRNSRRATNRWVRSQQRDRSFAVSLEEDHSASSADQAARSIRDHSRLPWHSRRPRRSETQRLAIA